MPDVEDKCRESGGADELCPIMQQVADEFGMDWLSDIDRRTYPKIVFRYEELSGRRYGGESLHPGAKIYFSQFVRSVIKHWR